MDYQLSHSDPREVVETYRHPEPEQVVEVYTRPLPRSMAPKAPSPSAKLKKKRRKGVLIFLACVLAVVLLAAAARFLPPLLYRLWSPSPYYGDNFGDYYGDYWYSSDDEDSEITIPTYPIGQNAKITIQRDKGESLTAQEIYQKVNPTVVTVMVQLSDSSDYSRMGVGTGVIFTEDGYILTNHHVVEGGCECSVMLSTGHVYEAKYVASDAENDLAVLKVEQTGLPAAELVDSDTLTVGDKVYAIGNPLGVELRGTFTDGIVSAINRDVQVDSRTMTLIQTNAALNSGNSGGPLINDCGQVVGINVVKMMSSYDTVEGLGFAIPTASMERIVGDLLEYGEVQPQASIGISVQISGTDLGNGLRGIQVLEVTPDSSADRCGVEVGDFVIAAGGVDIDSSAALLRVRNRYHLGDEMPMTIWRDGQTIEVVLLLDQAAE